jgi:signal transduction histidine kinase
MEIPYRKLHTFRNREKIFSPFYSTKRKGTGLGLSIAQKAVRKNMGRIRIEPVENAGTRVVLSLPLYREGGE